MRAVTQVSTTVTVAHPHGGVAGPQKGKRWHGLLCRATAPRELCPQKETAGPRTCSGDAWSHEPMVALAWGRGRGGGGGWGTGLFLKR